MKKIISSILISFVLLLNISIPITVFAEVTVWSYKETVLQISHGPFDTQEKCIADLNSFTAIGANRLIQTTLCLPSTIAGYPIPDPAVPVNAKIDVSKNKSVYTMLAPIAGLKTMNSDGCAEKDTSCIDNNIGNYLNLIFKLGIGICAALAVIMIIIGGVTYMGDESIFGKTEAKHRIYSAILGLLIALGAWALLNTINPALTGAGGLKISGANIEVETQPLTKNDPFVEGSTTTISCPSGVVNVQTVNGSIPACKTMQVGLAALIDKAKSEGINLFGYGYRSKAKQEALRAENCGGTANIYNKDAKCNPPTAMPGYSRHESGLAVDFQCNGSTIRSRDNECFVWLSKYAGGFGYKNLQSEPWHWSIDGR